MNLQRILVVFLKFGGLLEIFLGIMFFFLPEFLRMLGISIGIPFFSLFAAVELIILGVLLFISAYDVGRYTIIILVSCIFRLTMAIGPELYTMITQPILVPFIIGGTIYDILSAILTLWLLVKLSYLKELFNNPIKRLKT